MLPLALKMLFGDTAKYLMLLAGLFFATFLIVQQSSVFIGVLRWTSSTVQNVGAPLYVTEERVEQINETNPLKDTDVDRVRSVSSVRWAMPLFSGLQRVRMPNGSFKTVQLLGIDAASLAGAPARMIAGHLDDLRLPNTVVIDKLATTRLAMDKARPLQVGDVFEINDIEARVVGICETSPSFTGGPYIWTTYDRALSYAPPARKMLQLIIAAPVAGVTPAEAARDIERQTHLRAYINGPFGPNPHDEILPDGSVRRIEFNTSTMWWFVRNTGIPIAFGITVIIGFVVGMAISCQTFYAFVLDNLKYLGAFKTMGMGNARLSMILLVQSATVGVIGFGLGLVATWLFARYVIERGEPPFYMPWQVPVIAFGVIQLICAMAALFGIVRLSVYEPAMAFRS